MTCGWECLQCSNRYIPQRISSDSLWKMLECICIVLSLFFQNNIPCFSTCNTFTITVCWYLYSAPLAFRIIATGKTVESVRLETLLAMIYCNHVRSSGRHNCTLSLTQFWEWDIVKPTLQCNRNRNSICTLYKWALLYFINWHKGVNWSALTKAA